MQTISRGENRPPQRHSRQRRQRQQTNAAQHASAKLEMTDSVDEATAYEDYEATVSKGQRQPADGWEDLRQMCAAMKRFSIFFLRGRIKPDVGNAVCLDWDVYCTV